MEVIVQGHKINVQKALDEIMKVLPFIIEIKEVEVRKDKYIEVECTPFARQQLGVFMYAVEGACALTTFNSELQQDSKTGDYYWWSTWVLNYPGNCMKVCEVRHNITKDIWTVRTVN